MSSIAGMDKPSALKKIRDGGSALYVQIAGVMRRKMRSGEWPPGIQLPTLEQLAEQLGVARVTVRQANGFARNRAADLAPPRQRDLCHNA